MIIFTSSSFSINAWIYIFIQHTTITSLDLSTRWSLFDKVGRKIMNEQTVSSCKSSAFSSNTSSDVSKVSSGFAYFLLIFAPGSVLALYSVVLGAAFDSASNGAFFDPCCPAQKGGFAPNTGSKARFLQYFLLTFAPGAVLALYWAVLDVEFDSLLNNVVSDRGCRGQSGCPPWNTVILSFKKNILC